MLKIKYHNHHLSCNIFIFMNILHLIFFIVSFYLLKDMEILLLLRMNKLLLFSFNESTNHSFRDFLLSKYQSQR